MAREYHELGDGRGALLRTLVELTAHVSWRAALVVAQRIKSPWYRTQSLATVLKRVPSSEAERLLLLARDAAVLGPNAFQRVGARAWIVGALFARGDGTRATDEARAIVAELATIEHDGARSEALGLLARTLRGNALELERTVAELAARAAISTAHWRTKRVARLCIRVLSTRDRPAAVHVAELVEDAKTRRRIARDFARNT